MAEQKWVNLCIIGGILMIVSGTVGSVGFIGTLIEKLSVWAPSLAPFLSPILWILTIIAMGGGISVIIGCLIYNGGNEGTGKFIVGLGAGMGLFGLIIAIISSIIGGNAVSDATAVLMSILNGSYGLVGAFLTVVARIKM